MLYLVLVIFFRQIYETDFISTDLWAGSLHLCFNFGYKLMNYQF